MRHVLIALVCIAGLATTVRAENFSLDFGVHYAKLKLAGDNAGELDNADGAAFDVSFKFAPNDSGLRIGGGLMAAGWYREFETVDPNDSDITDTYQSLSIIVPEFRIGYHLPLGDKWDNHFFIEPSVGVGVAVGAYSSGDIYFGTFRDDRRTRTRANLAVHPKVQVGYAWDRFALGLEGSYLWTNLDFGNDIGGDLSTWTAGVFFRFSF